MKKFVSLLSFVMLIPCIVAGAVYASEVPVKKTFRMPVQVNLNMAATGCSNSPGPQITMQGEMALSGLGVDLVFSNNQKGTHTHTDGMSVEDTLIEADHTVVLPKQPVLGGVGGNPFIWVQLTDLKGTALTSELYLGRCVQGALHTNAYLTLPVTAAAEVSAANCSNAPGPYITLDGAMTLSGLGARLIFRNNDNPVGGPHSARDEMRFNAVRLQPGTTIQFPKQPVLGGVGGNPWISLGFLDGGGDPLSSATLLGRCVQMSK